MRGDGLRIDIKVWMVRVKGLDCPDSGFHGGENHVTIRVCQFASTATRGLGAGQLTWNN